MKKEELLDLITELKVDDRFIEDALSDGLDGRPVRVYAEPPKRSPMKIIASVAACLAVIAGAGFVIKNMSSPNVAPITPASEGDVSESEAPLETSEPETNDTESSDVGYNYMDYATFPSQKEKFVEKCKEDVVKQFGALFPTGVYITWQVDDYDIDCDNHNELVLCPRVNGRSIRGVGVCMFKIGRNDSSIYLGSFGGEFNTLDFKKICIAKIDNGFLYFNNNEEGGKCIDSIQRVIVDKDTGTVAKEETYLRLVKNHSDNTSTAYRNGEQISTEELLSEWNSHMENTMYLNVDFPLPNISGAHTEAEECVKLLVDKYNVPLENGSLSSLHRTVEKFDINFDGEDETIIEFRRCAQLPGIYVFSSDGRLIGEFDLECERGEPFAIGGINVLYGGNVPVISKFDKDGESYYYYRTYHSEKRFGNGWASVGKETINRIVVNEDGTVSSKVIMEEGAEFISDTGLAHSNIRQINGKDVDSQEYYNEIQKYSYRGDHPFIW